MKRDTKWRELRQRISTTLTMQKAHSAANLNLVINMKAEPDGNSFILDHPAYPKARVKASFRADLPVNVNCSYQRTENSNQVDWEYTIEFFVDELDEVHFQHEGKILSNDEVALLILGPVRDPSFTPTPQ